MAAALSGAAWSRLRVRFEIDDDVRDRELEALPRALDEVLLQPVRPPGRMGRDDDLVRAERSQRVLERLQRISVADLAARGHSIRREARQAGVEPLLRRSARPILVRDPVTKMGR